MCERERMIEELIVYVTICENMITALQSILKFNKYKHKQDILRQYKLVTLKN